MIGKTGEIEVAIRFDNRVAVVTGAGAGLGRSHAMLLASRGAKVVINDPGGSTDGKGGSNAVADKVVEEIKAAGGLAVANYDSVADPKGAVNIVKTAIDKFGKIDIVVANAGILRDKSFAKMDMEDFDIVVKVHLMGTAYVTKAAWQYMIDQKYGRVVLHDLRVGPRGKFRPIELWCRQGRNDRPHAQSHAGRRQVQHQGQLDLASRRHTHDAGPDAGRNAEEARSTSRLPGGGLDVQ